MVLCALWMANTPPGTAALGTKLVAIMSVFVIAIGILAVPRIKSIFISVIVEFSASSDFASLCSN